MTVTIRTETKTMNTSDNVIQADTQEMILNHNVNDSTDYATETTVVRSLIQFIEACLYFTLD